MLCYFLLYNEVNQLYVYIYTFPLVPGLPFDGAVDVAWVQGLGGPCTVKKSWARERGVEAER